MGYRIRYGPAVRRGRRTAQLLRNQTLISAGIGLAVCLAGLCWADGRKLLRDVFCTEDLSSTEQALQVMAQTISSGEGWYHGAVAFCRVLLGVA